MLIGSHVGMKGKDMFLGSVKEALSYGANTFMVYTGAPQNTRRKKIEELRIEDGTKLMKEHGMETFVVHAPYIINLANTTKPETFELAVEFLEVEVERTKAMGSHSYHRRIKSGHVSGYAGSYRTGDNGRKRKRDRA